MTGGGGIEKLWAKQNEQDREKEKKNTQNIEEWRQEEVDWKHTHAYKVNYECNNIVLHAYIFKQVIDL